MQDNSGKITRENQSLWRGSTFPLFFILAIFNVVGIIVSLYVTHRFEGLYESAAQARDAWNHRREGVETLRDLVMDIDGPPNDVFDDHDVQLEAARLERALRAFSDRLQIERREVRRTLSPQNAAVLLAGFDVIEEKTARIAMHARDAFAVLRANDWGAGARQMAIADRLFRGLGPTIDGLNRDILHMETISVDEAGAEAVRLRRLEVLIASLFGLLMIAVAANGYQVARRSGFARRREQQYLKALSLSDERFNLATRATNDVIWDWNMVEDRVWCNERFGELTGYPLPEDGIVSSNVWRSGLHPQDSERVGKSLDSAIGAGAKSWWDEYRFALADGTFGTLLSRALIIRDETGKPIRMVGAMMDLTDRKRAEMKMAELSRRNEMILEAAGDGIFGVDLEGRATFLNPAASRMTGFTFEQIRNETVHRTVHRSRADGTPVPFDECPSCRAMQRGETIDATEGFFSRADGTPLPVEYTTTPMRDESGDVIGAVVTFRDVSERRAVQKMKDEFVSVVSHELRTPLTSIRGALGLLAGGLLGQVTEKGQRMLEIAVSNTDRLVRLINDMLDIERIGSGKVTLSKQMCDTADVMRAAADLMRPLAEKSELTLEVYTEPAEVWADADRLQQTFTNLLSNAIKFSTPGGRIVFSAVRTPENITFEVRDAGRGIPADKLRSIFERFQQVDASDSREKGGTGLGLAICRSIVNEHGGEIWAESEPGLGSRFFVSLPAVKTKSTLPLLAPIISPSARSIFLCDDDPSVREIMQVMLEQKGYDVSVFASGEELLRGAKVRQPDVILLDLFMPEMNGWEVLARLKSDESTAHIPIVIVSVLTPEDAPDVVGWVQKPLDEKHLLKTLDRALHLDGRKPRIMLVEDDDDLARVIVASFDRHGIETFHARTGSEAIDLAGRLDPDLLVLDLVLPEIDGFGVIEWLKEHDRLQSVPLVVYSAAEPTPAERDRLRLGPTLFLTKSRMPPHEFEERVINLLNSITTAKGAVAIVH